MVQLELPLIYPPKVIWTISGLPDFVEGDTRWSWIDKLSDYQIGLLAIYYPSYDEYGNKLEDPDFDALGLPPDDNEGDSFTDYQDNFEA